MPARTASDSASSRFVAQVTTRPSSRRTEGTPPDGGPAGPILAAPTCQSWSRRSAHIPMCCPVARKAARPITPKHRPSHGRRLAAERYVLRMQLRRSPRRGVGWVHVDDEAVASYILELLHLPIGPADFESNPHDRICPARNSTADPAPTDTRASGSYPRSSSRHSPRRPRGLHRHLEYPWGISIAALP